MRILLAEDDGRLAEPLVAFLERERHSVTWLADGRTALDALIHARGEHDSYDLALLDWMLPGLDGLSILRELRRRNLTTLVLMITARDGLEDVVAGLAGGADDYLVKPFRMASWRCGSGPWNAGPIAPTSTPYCAGGRSPWTPRRLRCSAWGCPCRSPSGKGNCWNGSCAILAA